MPMPWSNRKIYSNTVIVFLKNKEQLWTNKGATDTSHLWNTSEYLEYLVGRTAINDTRLFRWLAAAFAFHKMDKGERNGDGRVSTSSIFWWEHRSIYWNKILTKYLSGFLREFLLFQKINKEKDRNVVMDIWAQIIYYTAC